MKTSFKLRALCLLAAALLSLLASGCNTMRGVGRDVEHVGDHIENAANR
jgi:predicted small secreted protein